MWKFCLIDGTDLMIKILNNYFANIILSTLFLTKKLKLLITFLFTNFFLNASLQITYYLLFIIYYLLFICPITYSEYHLQQHQISK